MGIMNQNLFHLYKYLHQNGLIVEAQLVSNVVEKTTALKEWQNVLNATREPLPDQIMTAIQYLKNGATEMYKNMEPIKNLSEDDLKNLVILASKAQTLQSQGQINLETLTKQGQAQLAKSLWSGTKLLGKQTLHLMPYVGFIFSFLFGLKNFVYGLTTFAKLAKDSEQIGLTWLEILFPGKLNEKVTIYKNDPKQMQILTRLTRYSQEFSTEGISLIANIIDFIKDVIFLFIDIGSFGWLIVGDISLSIILMAIQYVVQSESYELFENTINDIVSISNSKIKELSVTDFDSMNPEELNQWFLNH